jgi:hypothetical protein
MLRGICETNGFCTICYWLCATNDVLCLTWLVTWTWIHKNCTKYIINSRPWFLSFSLNV